MTIQTGHDQASTRNCKDDVHKLSAGIFCETMISNIQKTSPIMKDSSLSSTSSVHNSESGLGRRKKHRFIEQKSFSKSTSSGKSDNLSPQKDENEADSDIALELIASSIVYMNMTSNKLN